MPATILLVTDNRFWVGSDGAEHRLSRLHDDLVRAGFVVSVFYLGELRPLDHALIRQARINVVEDDPRRSWMDYIPILHLFRRAAGRRRWKPHTSRGAIHRLADFQNPFAKRKFDAYFQRMNPDVVLIVKVHLAYLVEGIRRDQGRPLVIIDTHDVMYQRAATFARNGQKHWLAISREEESQVLSRFDIVMAIQSQEGAIFRAMLPDREVVVTPLSVTVGGVARPDSSPTCIRLGYLGSGGPSNLLALQQFIPQVFAGLRKRLGTGIEFHIAGKICDRLAETGFRGADGITLRGLIESPNEFWDHVDIAVNPVGFGGGLKIKNIEALARGCALVTTTIGAQGMEQGAGQAFLVADTAESQIAVIATLVEDSNRRRELGQQSRVFADQYFSFKPAMAELCAAIARCRRAV